MQLLFPIKVYSPGQDIWTAKDFWHQQFEWRRHCRKTWKQFCLKYYTRRTHSSLETGTGWKVFTSSQSLSTAVSRTPDSSRMGWELTSVPLPAFTGNTYELDCWLWHSFTDLICYKYCSRFCMQLLAGKHATQRWLSLQKITYSASSRLHSKKLSFSACWSASGLVLSSQWGLKIGREISQKLNLQNTHYSSSINSINQVDLLTAEEFWGSACSLHEALPAWISPQQLTNLL